MKLFTKIALGIAGFFAGVAVICMVIAFAMGFTLTDFREMVYAGKFSFDLEDAMELHLFDEDDFDVDDYDEGAESENHSSSHGVVSHANGDQKKFDITHACTRIDVEYGAGKLDIYYGDVSCIQVIQENVPGFDLTTSDIEETLHIEGGLGITDYSDASLTIILPRGVELEVLELETGASQASLDGILANEMCIIVGAGEANLANLTAGHLDLEVGAGSAKVTNLQVENLDVEAGVGEVDVEIAGVESDYNYSLECGIGEVNVGDKSYGGVGAEQNITNPDAQHHMDIECGIGEVNVHFTGCDVNDGTCEDESHNHHGNTH